MIYEVHYCHTSLSVHQVLTFVSRVSKMRSQFRSQAASQRKRNQSALSQLRSICDVLKMSMTYNCQVEAAETAEKTSSSRIAHYSYDFAQQIHFPYDSQQTEPEYFKTAHKCGLFRVSDNGKWQMVLYLIDEAENPGKGADCVISLLHH